VDAGCGAGQWIDRLLRLGHRVIGIEQAPEMIKVLERKSYGPGFTLVAGDMENVSMEPASADVVLAMGSLQYAHDPARLLRHFASWVKPGGTVCVLVDSFVALVLELLRSGKTEEALERLQSRRGVWKQHGKEADLHLLDCQTLASYFARAGLSDVSCKGLLVGVSVCGLEEWGKSMAANESSCLELERRLAQHPAMVDAGKQIIASGCRPVSPQIWDLPKTD
jgi:2-polyprenyl-6-hydroxyphenyl methylase/3-demethylubiquinone-9 3-methyltransferase